MVAISALTIAISVFHSSFYFSPQYFDFVIGVVFSKVLFSCFTEGLRVWGWLDGFVTGR
jgi:hypothetical protein